MNLTDKEKSRFMYHNLISQEGDFIGMIAYGLYKKNKIDFIVSFKNKNQGKYPSNEELKDYQDQQCLPNQINMIRENATHLFNDFLNILTEQEEEKIKQKRTELNLREKTIKGKERKLKLREKHCNQNPRKGFKSGVLQSLTGSFIFVVLSIIIIYSFNHKVDLLNFLTTALN